MGPYFFGLKLTVALCSALLHRFWVSDCFCPAASIKDNVARAFESCMRVIFGRSHTASYISRRASHAGHTHTLAVLQSTSMPEERALLCPHLYLPVRTTVLRMHSAWLVFGARLMVTTLLRGCNKLCLTTLVRGCDKLCRSSCIRTPSLLSTQYPLRIHARLPGLVRAQKGIHGLCAVGHAAERGVPARPGRILQQRLQGREQHLLAQADAALTGVGRVRDVPGHMKDCSCGST